jgi:hypothetical protein
VILPGRAYRGDVGTQASNALDRQALREFLAAYAMLLGAGDLEGITEHVDLPVTLVGPEASVRLSSPEEVRDAFRDRPLAARARETVAAVPEVVSVEEVGWALLWVDVRWSYRDEFAAERVSEQARYLLRRGRGTFEICVVVPVA